MKCIVKEYLVVFGCTVTELLYVYWTEISNCLILCLLRSEHVFGHVLDWIIIIVSLKHRLNYYYYLQLLQELDLQLMFFVLKLER